MLSVARSLASIMILNAEFSDSEKSRTETNNRLNMSSSSHVGELAERFEQEDVVQVAKSITIKSAGRMMSMSAACIIVSVKTVPWNI